jgi:hypothetical protein
VVPDGSGIVPGSGLESTLGIVLHGFWAGRKSPMFGVWAAPAAQQKHYKRSGAKPPTGPEL